MNVVSVDAYSESGTCDYCRKESREGVRCTFGDGSFSGFLCKADFWRFVRLRVEAIGREPSVRTASYLSPDVTPVGNGR